MTSSPKLTGRGGPGRGQGRPKLERGADPKVHEKVLRDERHELILKALIRIEMRRLGIDLSKKDFGVSDAPMNASIVPLTNLLHRMECRAFGNPVDTVNHVHDKPIELGGTVSFVLERIGALGADRADRSSNVLARIGAKE